VALMRGIYLLLQQMYPGVRKIGKPTCMVKIEMCQNNMPHIRRVKPERFYTCKRRQLLPPLDIIHQAEKARQTLAGVAYIVTTEPRIHQNQPIPVRFNQQTVADQMRVKPFTKPIIKRAAKRAHATTVEVVNFH
jgi:hypothetical protein